MKTSDFFSTQGLYWWRKYGGGTPRLVISDFDGTLAAIAPTPASARLSPAMLRLLRQLVARKDTQVAIISGRGIADLSKKVNLSPVVYVGNHGLTCSRTNLGFQSSKMPTWFATAGRAYSLLTPLTLKYRGCRLELKGPDVSLHYRQLDPKRAIALRREAKRLTQTLPLIIKAGKQVLEFRPHSPRNKGWALRQLARRLASGWKKTGFCVYLGDDRTDEDAFAAMRRLGPRAVGLKVGGGNTDAHFRLKTLEEVKTFLARLVS